MELCFSRWEKILEAAVKGPLGTCPQEQPGLHHMDRPVSTFCTCLFRCRVQGGFGLSVCHRSVQPRGPWWGRVKQPLGRAVFPSATRRAWDWLHPGSPGHPVGLLPSTVGSGTGRRESALLSRE